MAAGLDAVGMLARLVAFDTTSAKPNIACVEFVRQALADHGVAARIIPDATGTKAALHAVIGPPVAGGIALSAHIDCVPVDGQPWRADPFALRREDGRLIARGAVDMKGFWACVMAAVPGLRAKELKRPVHLCLSFDEETTFAGAPLLVDSLAEAGPPPAMCIVGEPTGMAPVVAHKGYASWNATVTGLTGHSSLTHRTANALEAAAEAVAILKRIARRFARDGRRAAGFEPPWTTVHTGTFHAGTILNIVPDRADFVFEVRSIPGDAAEDVLAELQATLEQEALPELRAAAPDAGFTFARRCTAPPCDLPSDSPLLALVRDCGAVGAPARVPYGTEAGIFQRAGIAAIVCGPGQVSEAHQPEEWIAESQIAACSAFLDRLGDRLAA
ncbi:acetylornithine deacetylase [Falsiroseomonas oryzae]|uniref:acetylornithine deacetylase n=1 Tax=Falsiroseomonas oryzae TaxID=2766473 RepID=UPI0022EB5315|nr:acetylornithine deacetylase [Roseomonas sp. MO-31]